MSRIQGNKEKDDNSGEITGNTPKSRKFPIEITPEIMNWEQVFYYCGGHFSREEIKAMLRNDLLRTFKKGKKMLTRKRYVDALLDEIFEKPIQNEIIETIPLGYLNKRVRRLL